MTPNRLLRMAWTGTIVATVSAFLYLAYAPIPGSHAVDTFLTIGIALLGAVIGTVLGSRLERSIEPPRSETTTTQSATGVDPSEMLVTSDA
jgi:hypothetical protein